MTDENTKLASERALHTFLRNVSVYKPEWADEGERLVFVNGREREYIEEAGKTGDATKKYIFRDIWKVDKNDMIIRLTTCEYAVKGEDGKGKIWKRCAQGVDFDDVEPFDRWFDPSLSHR